MPNLRQDVPPLPADLVFRVQPLAAPAIHRPPRLSNSPGHGSAMVMTTVRHRTSFRDGLLPILVAVMAAACGGGGGTSPTSP